MFESGTRVSVAIALATLVIGGCAPSAATSPPPSSVTGHRQPSTDGPTNFAHPNDMIQRYPTMRRQDL